MKFFTFFVALLALVSKGKGRLTSIGRYSDDFSDVDFPDDREDCSDGTCSLYAEKRMIVPEKVVEHRKLVPRFSAKLQSSKTTDSFTQWQLVCGCMTQHKIIDLGDGHYPRYITTVRCKPEILSNKFCQCNYYDYRVHILVERGINSRLKNADELDFRDVEVQDRVLPKSLQPNWQMISTSVSVACIPCERS